MGSAEVWTVHNATHKLEIRELFDSLSKDVPPDSGDYAAYAHHLAKACWCASRIILRQTSPEAEQIFDLIIEMHRACNGEWQQFCDAGLKQSELDAWLEFSGMFLSNFGNYFGDGDTKVMPDISKDSLRRMASISQEVTLKLEGVIDTMMAAQPSKIGYPGETSQSPFYPGKERITAEEVAAVNKMIESQGIGPENTRLSKVSGHDFDQFQVLQACVETDDAPGLIGNVTIGERLGEVFLHRGDFSEEMKSICLELQEAREHASSAEQKAELTQLIGSFSDGTYLTGFWTALKMWVKDKAPRVEHSLGWLCAYHDPHGARGDLQACVGIADTEDTRRINELVEMSPDIIRSLPWATPENSGKGPFETSNLETPVFQIIHVLAFVSSIFWEANNINLNDNDGQNYGVKNLIYGNRMNLNSQPGRPCYYVEPSQSEAYMSCAHVVRFIGTVIHEVIGHGSGKLLAEPVAGEFNFNYESPPVSPLTSQPIQSWYKPKESWNSIFGKLALTVEECRAFLFAYYLADNQDILALFGYHETSTPTAHDLLYYTYIHIGVEGLRALHSFKADTQTWGGDHAQALFAIFKHLLQDGDGVIAVDHDPIKETLYVRVDRNKIISHGKPSIERMLCNIHVWRCTADVDACRPFYQDLSNVDGQYETWRKIVVANKEPKWKFVQPNTFLNEDGTVELREYEANNVGIIKSFYERNL